MITNLSLRDEHLIKDYYTSLFIKLTNLNPFITITIIKYDNRHSYNILYIHFYI